MQKLATPIFLIIIWRPVLLSPQGWAKLLSSFGISRNNGEMIMQWTAPAFEEVCLNCEINSYASAKL
jgi:coenzyme PQQ precursor peptide PqqA